MAMGQAAVERCVGRLLTDERSRARFRRDPDGTLAAIAKDLALTLTPAEVGALCATPAEQWESLAAAIDPRLQRLDDGRETTR